MNFQKSHFRLIIYFLLVIIIVSSLAYYIKKSIEIEKLNTIETNLLLVQAKTNNIKRNSQINKDNSLLIGEKIAEYKENSTIHELIDKGIISQEEYDKYYIFDKNTLYKNGLEDAIIENNEYILVNYETGEIVLSKPYIYNKHEYYKLSEIKQIER